MNPALQKTIAFVLLIVIGFLLQRKIKGSQDLKGVKVLILSVILPATIFVALLKVEMSTELLVLPLLALTLNGLLYAIARPVLPRLGIERDSPQGRTLLLLIPSLAPGLSCFPFVLEYLGEDQLAMAALADVGNKFFVLIVLYLLAMNWYYRSQQGPTTKLNGRTKLKDLMLTLVREPVNVIMLLALVMLALGLSIEDLPLVVDSTVTRLAALMTPIVLLFIGMAVRFKRSEMTLILRILCFRSGVALLLSGLLVSVAALDGANALLAVVFGQCAVSFWPYAHMAAVEGARDEATSSPVFDLGLGLNLLAFSLPFSTVVILLVLSCGEWFVSPATICSSAIPLLAVPAIYAFVSLLNYSKIEGAQAGTQVQG